MKGANNIKKIKKYKRILMMCIIVIIVSLLFLLASNIQKNKKSFIEAEKIAGETVTIQYELKNVVNEKCKILVTINSSEGIEKIKYLTLDGNEIELSCENKLSAAIDYDAQFQNTYYFTVKQVGENEKVESIYIKMPDTIDFISKMPSPTYQGTSDEYYTIGGYYVGGFNPNLFYRKNGDGTLTSNPVIIASDTGAYTYMYSKNKIESNIKTIDIEVRTRNDGINYGPSYIGLVSNPGANPTWVTNAYVNWNGATTTAWTTYKNTITIPDGINASDYYFEIYLGHVGHAYTMWMDFQTLKGLF